MLVTEMSSAGLRPSHHSPTWIVVFGANTGGPQALLEVLPGLPSCFPGAILVVQQMRPGFTRVLADQLSQVCMLPVCEPDDGQAIQAGRIYVAPGDARLTIANVGDALNPAYSAILEEVGRNLELKRTRVDAAMASAAQTFGKHAVGVLLTGVGMDGREGMRAVRDAGGITIAQDEATSVVHALPAAAIDAGVVQEVLPLWNMAEHIGNIVGGQANASAA